MNMLCDVAKGTLQMEVRLQTPKQGEHLDYSCGPSLTP